MMLVIDEGAIAMAMVNGRDFGLPCGYTLLVT